VDFGHRLSHFAEEAPFLHPVQVCERVSGSAITLTTTPSKCHKASPRACAKGHIAMPLAHPFGRKGLWGFEGLQLS